MNSTFVQRGYNGLVDVVTEEKLDDLIRAAFPTGSEVQMDLTLSLVRMRQLCQEPINKWLTKCEAPLTDDGICTSADRHYVPEPEEVEA